MRTDGNRNAAFHDGSARLPRYCAGAPPFESDSKQWLLPYTHPMHVTFTRTAARRYRVSVDGPGLEPLYMDPAPGYDPRLPHDAAHFIVENELDIKGGIFGQLAAGGTAITFHSEQLKNPKRTAKRGKALPKVNRKDSLFSEHAVYVAQSRWESASIRPDTKIPAANIARVCQRFDEFSLQWSKLPIGGSITLAWSESRR
jgi:hypothetical protein